MDRRPGSAPPHLMPSLLSAHAIAKEKHEDDVAKAAGYGKKIELYPLSQAAHPPASLFVDAIDVVYDATIPWDMRYFESLNRIVQTEPWLTRDKSMIYQLKSIGIEKGKPFNPDAKTQDTLKAAVGEARRPVRKLLLPASLLRRRPLLRARLARCHRRPGDILRRPRQISRR